MSIITIDFETYYDKEFSLSKMTTEEYVNDSRFEVIGVGIKIDDGKTEWYTDQKQINKLFDRIDWSEHTILCHNTLFDGAILAWRYRVKPKMWLDTLCMARAIHGVDAGGSLKALTSRYQIGEKGNEVINALGKRLADFDYADLSRYGAYCSNDVDLTYDLYHKMMPFPEKELKLIDLTLRMYFEPTLMVDDALLVQRLEQIKLEKSKMLTSLMSALEVNTEEEVRKQLSSNPQFASLLEHLGVKPPMKVSVTTGKETYALAKTDDGFIALQEHENPLIQQLCAVRLGTKSTIEESRIERFINIGANNRGYLPVPLKYYGAHTGRWSGLDSVNFQNLPSRDKHKKTLKNAIIAPPNHSVINSDSSQIEARVLAWLAGQSDVVKQFANKEDVYSVFATMVYNRLISKANPTERFVGKTCVLGLGYGTGAKKLQQTLALGGAELDDAECKRIVDLYRNTNNKITKLWAESDRVLDRLMTSNESTKPIYLGQNEALIVDKEGIKLPNGLYIRYNNLRKSDGKAIYDSRRGVVSIWGGSVVENVVQALARIIVGEQMLWIARHYRPCLTVHDALVYVVPDDELEDAREYIELCMSTPPAWAEGLPVACEVKYGKSYGEC
jgi:DNA polymerase I-like protein with 3'-5' exonuclease and polymerase domains